MTENEAKAIKWMKNVRDDAVVTLDNIAKNEPNVSPMLYAGRKEKAETIINGFKELEQYRAIGTVEKVSDILQIISEGQDDVDERGVSTGLLHTLLEYAKYRNLLGEYEAAGLTPEQVKAAARLMDGVEEPRVSGEDLCRAVETQKEFIRRYREKYREEPEFDIVILEIMLELEARRAAETGKTGTVKEE